MGTLDGRVPGVGPLTAEELTEEINTELAELFARSFAPVANAAGTNAYTGLVALDRPDGPFGGFIMVVPNTNTAAATFNGVPLVSAEGAALQAGQLAQGMVIAFARHPSLAQYRVLTPLSAGAAPVVRTYLTASLWNKPGGLRYARARVQAGGGSGGGFSNSGTAVQGLAGGASSFGSFCSASGGGGGTANLSGADAGGSAGGSGTGGDINISGGIGQTGYVIATTTTRAVSGAGGNSAMGAGGGSRSFGGGVTTGAAATGYGGGGGGAAQDTAGHGGGGGGGGYAERIIAAGALPASVSVAVGAAGAAVGSTFRGGGAGSPGIVIVEEYY